MTSSILIFLKKKYNFVSIISPNAQMKKGKPIVGVFILSIL